MSNEQTTVDFSLPKSNQSFLVRYQTPEEERYNSIEARGIASSFGQLIENVAARVITEPIYLGERRKEKLRKDLRTLTNPLTVGIKAIHVTRGKTLSRGQAVPYYTEVFERNYGEIEKLVSEMDKIHGTNLVEKLCGIHEEYISGPTDATRIKTNYFVDGLIILSKLTLDGIGENLRPFGNLVPDVRIRERDGTNTEVTQLDGLFLPRDLKLPGIESASFREAFIRDLAANDPFYPIDNPPVLEVPALLEIKAHFRARWGIGNLSDHIPPYQMREVMQRIGLAFSRGDLAIAPRAIVYLRLRSLAPNSIAIFYTGLEFYSKWKEAIQDRIHEIESENIPDYFHANALGQLRRFSNFLECHEIKLATQIPPNVQPEISQINARQWKLRRLNVISPGEIHHREGYPDANGSKVKKGPPKDPVDEQPILVDSGKLNEKKV